MIKRIVRVSDYRGLKNWKCDDAVADFASVNVLYGANGTGKSTLSSLLARAASDTAWETGLVLEIFDGDKTRLVQSANDAFWRGLRVFDRDFVADNLYFDAEVPGAQPLLKLGKEHIDVERRRAELEQGMSQKTDALQDLQEKKKSNTESINSLMTSTGDTIRADLWQLGDAYDSRHIHAGSVKNRLSEGFIAPVNVDLEHERAIVNEAQLGRLRPPAATSFSLAPFVERVRSVLAQTAASQVIADLQDHADWSQWVQEGLALHGDRDICIYCTSTIPAVRQDALARHFDDSLVALQERIATVESDLRTLRENAAVAVGSLPLDERVFSERRAEFYDARLAVGIQVNEWAKGIDLLLSALEEKRKSLFSVVELPDPPRLLTVSFSDVTAILESHNQFVTEFDDRRKIAAERIELIHIEAIRESAVALTKEIGELEAKINGLSQTQQDMQRELAGLTTGTEDPLPLAAELNTDLAHLLGRSDLSFRVAAGAYKITRDDRPAANLSEGERNAIALLYFLRSLETKDTTLSECVVVIDDPVSSLDANNSVGCSAYLWTRLVEGARCRQVFITTHDFDFFRTWSRQLEARDQQRVRDKLSERFQLYELRCCDRAGPSGTVERSFVLASWPADPKLRRRLRSEYHYMFWRIAETLHSCREDPSIERAVEAATMLPNMCRRFLEAFLSRKEPEHVGNLVEQVRRAADAAGIDAASRTGMTRFLHVSSHADETGLSGAPDPPEAVGMLFVALEFVANVDSDHFDKMCAAVGKDPSALRGLFPEPSTPEAA
ncbi:MAG: AAA family ATPase [Actinobacteria bacterium]|nr:AAA family ATPase [Actinomycetota bacterium]